ncbi:hypothetical protein PAHAL_2G142900 [Panicum hallii]|uniref:Uncharacterized protein n=1 Tax=Panicum hallii TaxID=206008 RepID=A0A2S3GXZ3_9POAL|nr:hypothetical protein PAHAL_2G142900 [Panicum hallii]
MSLVFSAGLTAAQLHALDLLITQPACQVRFRASGPSRVRLGVARPNGHTKARASRVASPIFACARRALASHALRLVQRAITPSPHNAASASPSRSLITPSPTRKEAALLLEPGATSHAPRTPPPSGSSVPSRGEQKSLTPVALPLLPSPRHATSLFALPPHRGHPVPPGVSPRIEQLRPSASLRRSHTPHAACLVAPPMPGSQSAPSPLPAKHLRALPLVAPCCFVTRYARRKPDCLVLLLGEIPAESVCPYT